MWHFCQLCRNVVFLLQNLLQLLSLFGLPLQYNVYWRSFRLPDAWKRISLSTAMSILYLASSIVTSNVRLSGLSVASLADFSLSTEVGVKQRSFGNPDDGRSGMSIYNIIVVHVMKTACKYVEVLYAFAGFQQYSLSARMYLDLCRPLVPAVVCQVMLRVPFIRRHLSNTSTTVT